MEREEPKKRFRWAWLAGAGVLVVAVVTGAGFFLLGQLSMDIRILGGQTITLEYGEAFDDPGTVVTLYGPRFRKEGIAPKGLEVTVSDTVDWEKTGKYELVYHARYLGLEAVTRRTVRIVDTRCPQIILTEDPPGEVEMPYREAGFRAIDNYDGDITDRVVRTEELGRVLYAVVDSSGNPAFAERQIPLADTKAPEILLTGGQMLTITVGMAYEEPGYQALDDLDGDVTQQVEVSGEVDWLRPGTYALTYTVADSAENQASVTRDVVVEAKPRVSTIWPQEKVIYLTFDDGPGPETSRLLDILDNYGVKATFFVTDSGYPDLLRQIVDRGHSIGIHTASHVYKQVYADARSYFADLYQMQDVIREATGVTTTLLRFPGGSSNTVSKKTSPGLMSVLVDAVQDAGFQYFDWNVDSDDAGSARKPETVLENVINGVSQCSVAVVLQHDVHSYSVDAVEDIIVWGLNHGYRFQALNENSPGMHHGVNN